MKHLDGHLQRLRAALPLLPLSVRPTDEQLDAAALASCALDGSDLTDVPTDDQIAVAEAQVHVVAAAQQPDPNRAQQAALAWVDALDRADTDPDGLARAVERVEFARVRRSLTDRGTDGALTARATAINEQLVAGLVDPAKSLLRTSDQIVHDGRTGVIVHRPPAPSRAHELFTALDDDPRWALDTQGDPVDRLSMVGRLYAELWRLHPFEAANGRTARSLVRQHLRRTGIDPHGALGFDVAMAAQPMAGPTTIVAAIRAGEPRQIDAWWLEVIDDAAVVLADGEPLPAPDTRRSFTVADHARQLGTSIGAATKDLLERRRERQVVRLHGSLGLRWAHPAVTPVPKG